MWTNILLCSTYVQSLKDIYRNLNDNVIDKQIETEFSWWFKEYVSIDLKYSNFIRYYLFIILAIYNCFHVTR